MRAALAALLLALSMAAGAQFAPVVPGVALQFPRDRGMHPAHRIEWWYVTGQVRTKAGAAARTLGFQVTFFRVRNPDAEGRASRFAPAQLLFAHAAVADPARQRFLHDQRAARLLPPLVAAGEDETRLRLDDWTLVREGDAYRTRVRADGFTLELTLGVTQPVLLQGEAGFSRKGPSPTQASYYYSEPQLRTRGTIVAQGEALEVEGHAWLDHEWSSELLAADAQGWDWIGANLADGGALAAFRIRTRDGGTLWASATLRDREGRVRHFAAHEVAFTPRRRWRSPRNGNDYPVAMHLKVGDAAWRIEPLLDDQELDARGSTGTVYWEGAVKLEADSPASAGAGYLELTGYGERLRF